MAKCVAMHCGLRATLHLVSGADVGSAEYRGGSWCSVTCLARNLARSADNVRDAYPPLAATEEKP